MNLECHKPYPAFSDYSIRSTCGQVIQKFTVKIFLTISSKIWAPLYYRQYFCFQYKTSHNNDSVAQKHQLIVSNICCKQTTWCFICQVEKSTYAMIQKE